MTGLTSTNINIFMAKILHFFYAKLFRFFEENIVQFKRDNFSESQTTDRANLNIMNLNDKYGRTNLLKLNFVQGRIRSVGFLHINTYNIYG